MKKFWVVGFLFLALMWSASAATAYSLVGMGNGNQTGVVATSSVTTLTITADSYTIVHTGIQSDGSTASAATDYVVVMNSYDSTGAAVSMVADYSAGKKLIIPSGGSWVINGADVPVDANGVRKIQIQAVGNGATIAIKREK